MLADLSKSALDFLKLSPRYLFSIALISASFLFFPRLWLEAIGLYKFSEEYRQWLGLTLMISANLWVVANILALWKFLGRHARQRKMRREVVRKLTSLTEDEKQILRYYLAENTRANTLRVDDGVVRGLVTSRIIYQSASIGNLLEGFAHNLTDFAWDYLHEYPELLDGTSNYYRTDKRW